MTNHGFRQTRAGSCGAACLMCAALELGVTRAPARPDWGALWRERAPLACDEATELRLYSVTAGGAGRVPNAGSGHSLPSYICEAAMALGLTSSVYLANGLLETALELLFRSEIARAEALGLHVQQGPPPHPTPGTRLLRVIRNGPSRWFLPAVALHWVMQRPDASIMDPAGREFGHGPGPAWNVADFATLAAARRSQGVDYVDTGIGIMLRPG